MEEPNNPGKRIGVLLAIGVLLGILPTPSKGIITSKKLVKKSSELKDTLREKIGVLLSDIRTEEENEFLEMESQSWRS